MLLHTPAKFSPNTCGVCPLPRDCCTRLLCFQMECFPFSVVGLHRCKKTHAVFLTHFKKCGQWFLERNDFFESVLLLAGRASHDFLAGNILGKKVGSQKVIREVLESERCWSDFLYTRPPSPCPYCHSQKSLCDPQQFFVHDDSNKWDSLPCGNIKMYMIWDSEL